MSPPRFTIVLVACSGIALALTGCGATTANVMLTNNATRPAKPDDCAIKFWRTQKPAAGRYQEIATIEVMGNISANSTDRLQRLRKEACAVGADAVIVLENYTGLANVTEAVAIVNEPPSD